MGSPQLIAKSVYYAVAMPRLLLRLLLTSIATTYYRSACKEFGKNSVVRWGTWMRYPSNISIGDNVFIGHNVSIGSEIKESALRIGNSVHINDSVLVDYTGGLDIGEYTLIAEQAVIYTHSHGLNPHSRPTPLPKVIGNNCWIGTRCIVLESCGQLATDVVVGAGAVVSKSLDKSGVYVGVPARFLRTISDCEKQEKPDYALK